MGKNVSNYHDRSLLCTTTTCSLGNSLLFSDSLLRLLLPLLVTPPFAVRCW